MFAQLALRLPTSYYSLLRNHITTWLITTIMFEFLLFGMHDIKDESGTGALGLPRLPAEGLVAPVADDG